MSDGSRSTTVGTLNTANVYNPALPDNAVELSGWNLHALRLKPPAGYVGTLHLSLRATATEAGNNITASTSISTASTSTDLTLVVLPGTPVATPVGLNPYVSFAAQALAPSTAKIGSAAAPATPTIVRPAIGPDDEASDQTKRQRLSDAWLRELEAKAQAQWRAIVGVE